MRKKIRKFFKNARKKVIKQYFKMFFMRLIVLYQRNFSKHTCLYEPTCSEYMKRAINNKGVIRGIIIGCWRLLRCNPLSKGGYDPVPERRLRLKWVL